MAEKKEARVVVEATHDWCDLRCSSCCASDNGTIETCEDLARRIIDLSEKNKNPFSAVILKFYDISNQEKSAEQILNCVGKAKLNRGDDRTVNFYLQQDADGDQFIGYEITS